MFVLSDRAPIFVIHPDVSFSYMTNQVEFATIQHHQVNEFVFTFFANGNQDSRCSLSKIEQHPFYIQQARLHQSQGLKKNPSQEDQSINHLHLNRGHFL